MRPARPKYSETWNTNIVLNYIEKVTDLDKLKLKEISQITATLLILITAHTVQTLALIKTENIVESTDGIRIKIPDLIKTSGPGVNQPLLSIPFFKERKKICVASIILYYLDRAKKMREKSDKLFITTIKPHRPATTQTVTHWIKGLLNKAGVDTKVFTAYSAKHAAVSKSA